MMEVHETPFENERSIFVRFSINVWIPYSEDKGLKIYARKHEANIELQVL